MATLLLLIVYEIAVPVPRVWFESHPDEAHG